MCLLIEGLNISRSHIFACMGIQKTVRLVLAGVCVCERMSVCAQAGAGR